MRTKTTKVLIIFLLLLSNKTIAQSQNFGSIDYNKAVNISGKQRMLSQKMSKAFLLLSKGINNDKIKKELNSSKFIFEKQLDILNQNAQSSSTKLYLKQVYKIWSQFKDIINSSPNLTNAKKIMDLNTSLLKACHQVVMSIETTSNYSNKFFENNDQELVKTINISGKQRMLSQRMCLYFTAIKTFYKDRIEYQKVLESVFDEFSEVIGYLLINVNNTTDIEEEIGTVMSLWEEYQSNKTDFIHAKFELTNVYAATNDLTKSFNKITGFYEKVSKSH